MRDTIPVMAYRNVLRNGRRTLVTAVVLTVGIALFIFFDAILAGMDRLTIESMIDYGAASLSVRSAEYQENASGFPLEHGIPDPDSVIADLGRAIPGARGIAPRTKFLAEASNRRDALPALGIAVDPAADADTFAIGRSVGTGSWFNAGNQARGVVIGSGLAADLELKAGDWLLVSARTIYDTINADEFEIIGVVEGASPDVSGSGLFMAYGAARAFLGDELPVTEIDVALQRAPTLDAELRNAGKAGIAARAAVPGAAVVTIGDAAAEYLAMRQMKSKGSMMMIFVVLMIAGVGIVNTVLMSVYARIREIGVLRAYGMTRRDIRRLFSLEGLLVGAAGSGLGLALGAVLVWWSWRWGFPLDMFFGKMDMGDIPLSGFLRGEWKPATFAAGFLFGLVTSWIAAVIPARKAARLEAVDALRFV